MRVVSDGGAHIEQMRQTTQDALSVRLRGPSEKQRDAQQALDGGEG